MKVQHDYWSRVTPKNGRPPLYSVKDLAELLKLPVSTLSSRIGGSKIRPMVAGTTHKGCRNRATFLYEKGPFLEWHEEHWGHLKNE